MKWYNKIYLSTFRSGKSCFVNIETNYTLGESYGSLSALIKSTLEKENTSSAKIFEFSSFLSIKCIKDF